MTEKEFIDNAKREMVTISNSILDSITQYGNLNLPNNSPQRIKHADEFEEQFSTKTHVMLFNLLRQYENEHHTTISIPTGEKVEQVFELVLTKYGNHIACGMSLTMDFDVVSH